MEEIICSALSINHKSYIPNEHQINATPFLMIYARERMETSTSCLQMSAAVLKDPRIYVCVWEICLYYWDLCNPVRLTSLPAHVRFTSTCLYRSQKIWHPNNFMKLWRFKWLILGGVENKYLKAWSRRFYTRSCACFSDSRGYWHNLLNLYRLCIVQILELLPVAKFHGQIHVLKF